MNDRRARIVYGTLDLPDTMVAPQLLDAFRAAGGRALDLAHVYRDGEAERAVGRWLQARGFPDDVVVYAKGCHPPHCRPDLVRPEVERVREVVGVDRVDVFILHRDEPAFPIGAFADALLAEVEAGRIDAFGVSNWTLERTGELRAHLEGAGAADRLVAFSNHFSLAEMVSAPWPGCLASSKEELDTIGAMGLRMLAWSSLATGYFAGRDVASWASDANEARRDRARELGERLGVSATTIALAYCLHQPEHVLPVVGTRLPAHLDEALAAADVELTATQVEWLESGAGSDGSPNPPRYALSRHARDASR